MLSPSPQRPFFDTLAGMRGIAALAVVTYHFHWLNLPLVSMAVDLFFLLSGVVMERTHAVTPTLRFLAGRIKRLFPLYFLGSLLGMAAWGSLWGSVNTREILPAIFFVPLLENNGPIYPFDPPAWSLLFEFLAYVAFSVLRSTPQALLLLCLALVGIIYTHGDATLVGCASRALSGFYAGVLLVRFRRGWVLPIGQVCLVLVAAVLAIQDAALRLPLILLAQPMLVWLAIHTRPVTGVRAMNWLGRISYPVYILHAPLGMLARQTVTGGINAAASDAFAVAILVGWFGLRAAWRRAVAHRSGVNVSSFHVG